MVATCGSLLCSTGMGAQQRSRDGLSVEPFAGAFWDAYDIGDDNSGLGGTVGASIGLSLGKHVRLMATGAVARVADVGRAYAPDYFRFNNQWVLATLGMQGDVLRGRTSVSVGLEAGGAWRRIVQSGQVGDPAPYPNSEEWSVREAVVPTLAVRRAFGTRWEAGAGGRLHILHFSNVSPALTLGLAFR